MAGDDERGIYRKDKNRRGIREEICRPSAHLRRDVAALADERRSRRGSAELGHRGIACGPRRAQRHRNVVESGIPLQHGEAGGSESLPYLPQHVSIEYQEREGVAPALPAKRGYFPRRSFQHCELRASRAHRRTAPRPRSRRVRAHVRRCAYLRRPFRRREGAARARTESISESVHWCECQKTRRLPPRAREARGLRTARDHKGRTDRCRISEFGEQTELIWPPENSSCSKAERGPEKIRSSSFSRKNWGGARMSSTRMCPGERRSERRSANSSSPPKRVMCIRARNSFSFSPRTRNSSRKS